MTANTANTANPFEALAVRRGRKDSARRAAKSVVTSEKDAPMKASAMEEAREERNAQMARYRRHKADVLDALCHGEYGDQITLLAAQLKRLTIDSAPTLCQTIMGAEWLHKADIDTRQAILSIIGDAIVKLRIRNGLPPFDDGIGDEPPTAFQIIQKELVGV